MIRMTKYINCDICESSVNEGEESKSIKFFSNGKEQLTFEDLCDECESDVRKYIIMLHNDREINRLLKQQVKIKGGE